MTDTEFRTIADKFLIRELIDEYSNLCTRRTCDRLGELFIEDSLWRTRGATYREFRGREAIVQAIGAVVLSYPLVVQMPHAPQIRLEGDRASATTLMHEIGKLDNGTSSFAVGVYHDKFVRTEQGWKFAERLFEALHQETGQIR